jgi:sensor c-di-GMP phosphodiesterase-like protein
VDDFGTGYSSLSYLRRLPIDTLKIDASFVRELQKGADSEAIVAAIIAMAKCLDLRVIAEGVETREQLYLLHAHGCHIVQGHYFSKSVAAADFSRFRRKHGDQAPLPIANLRGSRKIPVMSSAAAGRH